MARTKNVTREIDPRDVHRFNARLKVNARPVDTFVAAPRSSRAQTLAANLGMATQLGGQVKGIKQVADQKAQQEGHEAFLRGDETPEQVSGIKAWFTSQNKKRESFLSAKGGSDAVKSTVDVDALLNKATSVLDFETGIRDIRSKNEDGAGGDVAYLDTFRQHFDRLETSARTQFNDKMLKESRVEIDGNHASILQGEIAGIVTSLTPEEMISETAEVQQILQTKKLEYQKAAQLDGRSRTEASKNYLKWLTAEAVRHGRPELLDVVDFKDSGQSLRSLFPAEVGEAILRAERSEDRLAALDKVKVAEDQKLSSETLQRDYYSLNLEYLKATADGSLSSQAETLQKQMFELASSDLATDVSGHHPSVVAGIQRMAAGITKQIQFGTPEMTHRTKMAIASGDFKDMEGLLADPSIGRDNQVALLEILTDQGLRQESVYRDASLQQTLVTGTANLKSDLETHFGVNPFAPTRAQIKAGTPDDGLSFLPEISQAESNFTIQSEAAKNEITFLYTTGLRNRVNNLIAGRQVELRGKGQITSKEVNEAHKMALAEANEDAKAVTDRWQKSKDEAKAQLEQEQAQAASEAAGPPAKPEDRVTPPDESMVDGLATFLSELATPDGKNFLSPAMSRDTARTIVKQFGNPAVESSDPKAQSVESPKPLPFQKELLEIGYKVDEAGVLHDQSGRPATANMPHLFADALRVGGKKGLAEVLGVLEDTTSLEDILKALKEIPSDLKKAATP